MKHFLFALLLGAAACGGGGKKPDTKPTGDGSDATPTETMAKKETPPKEEMKKEEPPPPPEKPDPEKMKKDAMDAEMAAFEKAKPVFEGNCKSCHVKGQKNATAKKLASFDCGSYPFKGKMSGTADIRKVLGITEGSKATMPKTKPGSVKGDDLEAIKAWADAFDAAETAGAHTKAEPAAKEGKT